MLKQILLPILMILTIAGGFYYFSHNKKEEVKSTPAKNSPVVLGDSSDSMQGTNLGQDQSQTGSQSQSSTITDGQTYYDKIMALRKPINSSFEDLNSKIKYTTLFTSDDAKKSIDDLSSLVDTTINDINNLKIDKKFKDVNAKEIESLDLLQEALTALKQLYNSTDQEEQKKLNDTYNYKIEQSNNILNDIAIPK